MSVKRAGANRCGKRAGASRRGKRASLSGEERTHKAIAKRRLGLLAEVLRRLARRGREALAAALRGGSGGSGGTGGAGRGGRPVVLALQRQYPCLVPASLPAGLQPRETHLDAALELAALLQRRVRVRLGGRGGLVEVRLRLGEVLLSAFRCLSCVAARAAGAARAERAERGAPLVPRLCLAISCLPISP